MDEQRRLRVVKLAQAESRARTRWECLGMRNTNAIPADEREASSVEYRLAEAEWRDALRALNTEIQGPGRSAYWEGQNRLLRAQEDSLNPPNLIENQLLR